MEDTTYRGWRVVHHPSAPVTGRWQATRAGVSMRANDLEALRRMIDARLTRELGQ